MPASITTTTTATTIDEKDEVDEVNPSLIPDQSSTTTELGPSHTTNEDADAEEEESQRSFSFEGDHSLSTASISHSHIFDDSELTPNSNGGDARDCGNDEASFSSISTTPSSPPSPSAKGAASSVSVSILPLNEVQHLSSFPSSTPSHQDVGAPTSNNNGNPNPVIAATATATTTTTPGGNYWNEPDSDLTSLEDTSSDDDDEPVAKRRKLRSSVRSFPTSTSSSKPRRSLTSASDNNNNGKSSLRRKKPSANNKKRSFDDGLVILDTSDEEPLSKGRERRKNQTCSPRGNHLLSRPRMKPQSSKSKVKGNPSHAITRSSSIHQSSTSSSMTETHQKKTIDPFQNGGGKRKRLNSSSSQARVEKEEEKAKFEPLSVCGIKEGNDQEFVMDGIVPTTQEATGTFQLHLGKQDQQQKQKEECVVCPGDWQPWRSDRARRSIVKTNSTLPSETRKKRTQQRSSVLSVKNATKQKGKRTFTDLLDKNLVVEDPSHPFAFEEPVGTIYPLPLNPKPRLASLGSSSNSTEGLPFSKFQEAGSSQAKARRRDYDRIGNSHPNKPFPTKKGCAWFQAVEASSREFSSKEKSDQPSSLLLSKQKKARSQTKAQPPRGVKKRTRALLKSRRSFERTQYPIDLAATADSDEGIPAALSPCSPPNEHDIRIDSSAFHFHPQYGVLIPRQCSACNLNRTYCNRSIPTCALCAYRGLVCKRPALLDINLGWQPPNKEKQKRPGSKRIKVSDSPRLSRNQKPTKPKVKIAKSSALASRKSGTRAIAKVKARSVGLRKQNGSLLRQPKGGKKSTGTQAPETLEPQKSRATKGKKVNIPQKRKVKKSIPSEGEPIAKKGKINPSLPSKEVSGLNKRLKKVSSELKKEGSVFKKCSKKASSDSKQAPSPQKRTLKDAVPRKKEPRRNEAKQDGRLRQAGRGHERLAAKAARIQKAKKRENTFIIDKSDWIAPVPLSMITVPGASSSPKAMPPVWSRSRQEICETLPYFRSFQGGHYFNSGRCLGYLLDGFPGPQDAIGDGGKVIVSHGGGCSIQVPDEFGKGPRKTKFVLGKSQSKSNPRVKALLNCWKHGIPVALLAGSNYSKLPFLEGLGARYAVLGWYYVTLAWPGIEGITDWNSEDPRKPISQPEAKNPDLSLSALNNTIPQPTPISEIESSTVCPPQLPTWQNPVYLPSSLENTNDQPVFEEGESIPIQESTQETVFPVGQGSSFSHSTSDPPFYAESPPIAWSQGASGPPLPPATLLDIQPSGTSNCQDPGPTEIDLALSLSFANDRVNNPGGSSQVHSNSQLGEPPTNKPQPILRWYFRFQWVDGQGEPWWETLLPKPKLDEARELGSDRDHVYQDQAPPLVTSQSSCASPVASISHGLDLDSRGGPKDGCIDLSDGDGEVEGPFKLFGFDNAPVRETHEWDPPNLEGISNASFPIIEQHEAGSSNAKNLGHMAESQLSHPIFIDSETPFDESLGSNERVMPIGRVDFKNQDRVCPSCNHSFPTIYNGDSGWTCLNEECPKFFETTIQHGCDDSLCLQFCHEILQHQPVSNVNQCKVPGSLIPESRTLQTLKLPDLKAANYYQREDWKGFYCSNCGRLGCRSKVHSLQCPNCGLEKKLDLPVISPEKTARLLDRQHRILDHSFVTEIRYLDSRDLTQDPTMLFEITEFRFPALGNSGVIHMRPKSKASANEIFSKYQSERERPDFHRTPLKNHRASGALLSQHFTDNAGVPYKYSAESDTVPFDHAADAVRSVRTAISRAVLKTEKHELWNHYCSSELDEKDKIPEFNSNEVLSVCYMEGQKMNFHSDDEHGIGPVVASLSMGSDATMEFRPRPTKSQCAVPTITGNPFDSKKRTSKRLLRLVLQHGDVVVQVRMQEKFQHKVVTTGYRIAATARVVDSSQHISRPEKYRNPRDSDYQPKGRYFDPDGQLPGSDSSSDSEPDEPDENSWGDIAPFKALL